MPGTDPLTGLPFSMFARPMGQAPLQRTGGSNAEGHTPGRGLSVGEIYSQRENKPNARYGDGAAVPAGMRINTPAMNSRGLRRGGPIGSAAGALGSPGTPTSMRGRAEKYGDAFAEVPSWAMSQMMRDNAGGLAQDWSRGNMGMIPRSPTVAPGMGRTSGGAAVSENPNDPFAGRTTYGNAGSSAASFAPTPPRSTSPTASGDWFENLIRQFQPIF